MFVAIAFWFLLGIMFYTYFGYIIILMICSLIKKISSNSRAFDQQPYFPEVTLIIAAYNEKLIIDEKVRNALQQNYPQDKIHQIWITDGSTDGSEQFLKKYEFITILHQPQREGKTAALNRAMAFVKTPITIFTDANTMLDRQAILELVNPFKDSNVGCVSGEKRILMSKIENATASGEGIYWKYESFIKKLESNCGSTLSAAGELFAIRTELYTQISSNTILDDFVISTNIAKKGFVIKYSPKAFATERASASINEERKRKVRIAAGGFQSLFHQHEMLNPIKFPLLSFQFISHKVLRWVFLPLALLFLPILNIILVIICSGNYLYVVALIAQIIFYALVLTGFLFRNKQMWAKWLFLPYYLFITNISIIQGFGRYLSGKQNVKWEKSLRQT